MNQDPVPVVATVTGKDLLDKLDQLSTAFHEIRIKIDDVPAAIADHENRLRALERWRWAAAGAAGAIGAAVMWILRVTGRT